MILYFETFCKDLEVFFRVNLGLGLFAPLDQKVQCGKILNDFYLLSKQAAQVFFIRRLAIL